MFRQLVRRASKAPRQRVRVGKSAVSRSAAASTLLVESVLSSSPAAASNGHIAAFHTSAPRLEKKRAIAADKPPFEKLLAANRGEIATRIVRAASELGIQTAGIYAHEDRFTQHRYKCDQAFELDGSKGPVAQYLDIDGIVKICKQNGVQAVHPGYGFLSEKEGFAQALSDAGITFVGPTIKNAF